MDTSKYEAVIGLEVHAELMTNSKMFCGCPVVDSVEAEPNTAVCPVCLGMPGMLPVINRRAVEFAMKVGLALNCTIEHYNVFDRKNYFYPDLPKGYQVSQYELPLCRHGQVEIELEDGSTKVIRVRRVHMEEDTGKLTHRPEGGSLVDYNRSGVPLLEIVSEPDISSAYEARAYAMKLRQLLRYLEVNSGDLEKGVLRVEPNISIRPVGSTEFGTRTELKNLNSFKVLADGTDFELSRQAAILDAGGEVVQETRGWNEDRRETFSQRSKEDAHDYRYFPEPDLPELQIEPAWVEAVRASLPVLPDVRLARYRDELGLSAYEARLLAEDRPVSDWFEAALAAGGDSKLLANWLLNNLFTILNERKLDINAIPLAPAGLVELINLVQDGTINNNTAKDVLAEMVSTGAAAAEIVASKGLAQISDPAAIAATIDQILADNQSQVDAYLGGKDKLRGFFVGQAMRAFQGKADPALVNQVLSQKLDDLKAN
ncbi:MAG: Asp-tRNA(Asn)/Glu-tRNA(Gln) amidotransferase subunit GatB [Ardenticatenales bacterium]|nr:Asp-tRNA(Asn)/Glu-tRNA(Gln) amidotransferase subunit GatB [Ardenticatenales bacterium]